MSHNHHSSDSAAGHEHQHQNHHAAMVVDFRRRFWVSLAITIPILILSPLIQQFLRLGDSLRFGGDFYLLFLLSSIVLVYGGYPFLKGLADELKNKNPGMMTLIGLAIGVAYLYSSAVVFGLQGKIFFWELATLIDVMLLGHWIEMKSVMGASRALEELIKLMPSEAHKVLEDGSTEDISLDQIRTGDKLLVKPGEKIPADGKIIEGDTSVNEALLTGESHPVSKKEGDSVIGGAVNGEGSLTIEVEKTGEESFLSQVIDMVRKAQASKSKTQNLADRAALWLTVIAIVAGTITLAVWLLWMNRDFAFSLERTVSVMVITCPHALGLAIPLVVAVSTAISAQKGLLIRNRGAFEQARNIQAIIFDKTGTLTEGKFGVSEIVSLNGSVSNEDILSYAAAVESHSEHSLAKGIVAAVEATRQVKNFRSLPGKGVQGEVDGRLVKVVSPGYLQEQDFAVENEEIDSLSARGNTVVFVIIDNELSGAIALGDRVRPESRDAIRQLKKAGIQCMMLTGDNRRVAKWVAEELGLDDFFAEVLPDQKADRVKAVQSRGLTVAMVGDGVNDAPALARADVGIAIGAGTDVAVETADIVLVRSNPGDVLNILRLARATHRKMLQNLAWATGYNAFAIPLAGGALFSLGILLNPAVAAVLMSLSTVIVAINARLLSMPD